jgi:hypothetical protein
MYLMSKVILVLLFAAAIFNTCVAQSKDTVMVKDTSAAADSNIVTDSTIITPDTLSIKKVSKDSTQIPDSLAEMQKKFEQFQYGDVISMSNRLLLRKIPYTKKDLLDIYKMLGIAHYSLSEDDAAKKSFIEMLRIDSTFKFDSTKVSPKIISFFRQVKNDYVDQQKEIEARTVVRIDTVYIPQKENNLEYVDKERGAVARSLFVPGLGQLYKEEYLKGTILTVLSTAALISSIYFIIDTNEKEKAYLIETNPALIESKYQDYNSSFQKRNISLISYGVIWLYSQIDLLFLSDTGSESNPNSETGMLNGNNLIKNTSLHYDKFKGLTLNLKYFF